MVAISTNAMGMPVLDAVPQIAFGSVETFDLLAIPLFRATGTILLQSTGPSESELGRALIQVSTLDGVLETKHERWWTLTPGCTVGTLRVRIRSDANSQAVLKVITAKLKHKTAFLTIQIERDVPVSWMLGAQ